MRRLAITVAALAAALSTSAFGPVADAPVAAAPVAVPVPDVGDPDPFPLGACVFVRPVDDDRFCVYLNDPRP